jgi:hypothetical protein
VVEDEFKALPGLPGGGGGGGGGSGNAGGYSPPEGFSVGAGNGTLDYPFKGNGYRADGQNTLIEGPYPTTTVGESLNSTRWFSGCGGQSGQDPPSLCISRWSWRRRKWHKWWSWSS